MRSIILAPKLWALRRPLEGEAQRRAALLPPQGFRRRIRSVAVLVEDLPSDHASSKPVKEIEQESALTPVRAAGSIHQTANCETAPIPHSSLAQQH